MCTNKNGNTRIFHIVRILNAIHSKTKKSCIDSHVKADDDDALINKKNLLITKASCVYRNRRFFYLLLHVFCCCYYIYIYFFLFCFFVFCLLFLYDNIHYLLYYFGKTYNEKNEKMSKLQPTTLTHVYLIWKYKCTSETDYVFNFKLAIKLSPPIK